MSENYTRILEEDLAATAGFPLPWGELDNKTVLITGATGMLASYITHFLLKLNLEMGINVRTIILCRNRENAIKMFGQPECLTIMCQDVCSPIETEQGIDYILHFAGNASPYFIVNDPVGICRSNLLGTFNVAELAKEKGCRKVLFASTREVYGRNEESGLLDETSFGTLDCMEDRACYPESKRAAETILHSYHLQYGIPCCMLRIAHSYGPGMKLGNDGRVMADFMNDAVCGRDIVIKSTGEAERAFCYITDAVTAIMTVMLKGADGQAYNIANETEPMMIRDVAAIIAKHQGEISVSYKQGSDSKGYCNYRRTGLDTSKVEYLGWKPAVSLEEGIRRTLESFR